MFAMTLKILFEFKPLSRNRAVRGSCMSASKKHIIVVGAGIVGVSTAIWLQRDGHDVTLIDREGPAAGASFGNAGVLTSSSVAPIPSPGLWRKAPGMLFDPDQPLFLQWSALPRLLPFLRSYLANGRADRMETISHGLSQLLHDAPDQHASLAAGTGAEQYVGREDYIYCYDSRADYDADKTWELRRARGVAHQEMDAGALAAHDPALDGRFGFGVLCSNHGRISDPGAYVRALATHFEDQGGVLAVAEITGFKLEDGACVGVQTDAGLQTADAYVLTTGAWSDRLRRDLGVSVPVQAERGYHVEFTKPSVQLKSTVMVTGGKFVAHSMDGRMRCAGVVEFGDVDAPASDAPIALLKRQMKRYFPELEYDEVVEWVGPRPATPDSLPVVGVTPKASNVFVGYGHQHVGLSGGPKTGRWLSQLATGQSPNENLQAYAADRVMV